VTEEIAPEPEAPVIESDVERAIQDEQRAFDNAILNAKVEYLSQRVATLAGENARLRREHND